MCCCLLITVMMALCKSHNTESTEWPASFHCTLYLVILCMWQIELLESLIIAN